MVPPAARAAPVQPSSVRLPAATPAQRRRLFGAVGEAAVAARYESRGYRVLARNWRCDSGELDLVLASPDPGVVVFCEVKARSSTAFGHPLEAVTTAKAARVRRLALRWLADGRPAGVSRPKALRFDAAAVRSTADGLEVEIVTGAF